MNAERDLEEYRAESPSARLYALHRTTTRWSAVRAVGKALWH
jgi:hypothetical protein